MFPAMTMSTPFLCCVSFGSSCLKQNSIFHAKTILFIETILAYLKTHPSHASGDGKEIAIFFDRKKMGVSFNEEQDSDGTLFLTLNEIKEWSPAAKNGEVKSGWQLMEVDDQRLVNAGFNKLKEIQLQLASAGTSTSTAVM